MKTLSAKERLTRAVRGQEVDRIPTIGGWMNGPRNLAALAGISVEQYLADPRRGVVLANLALGVDAMVNPAVPTKLEEVRTGAVEESKFDGIEPEALMQLADSLPDNEREILAKFDASAAERGYRDHFENAFANWGGIVPLGNFWEIGGPFPLYTEFGYIAFLSACAMYPEHVGKIWWSRSVTARERAKILVKLYREYDLVPVMFCGEDLCNNQGPMASPDFLRQYYLPHVQMIIAPLVDAGIRLVHHCDGDVRPLVADFLRIGFSGFQGFQYEVGVDPVELRKQRSALGEVPIFFAGMSVSRTLPFGTPDDVRDEVDYFLDFSDGGRGCFLFTSNVTGVEVPPENIRTGYEYAKTRPFGQTSGAIHPRWPWAIKHAET